MAYNIKDLGSISNPVRCSGERGIRLYLDALFDSNGLPVQYKKLEDIQKLDCYEVVSSDKQTIKVYFDKLCAGYHEPVLIDGFKTYKDFMNYKEYTDVKYFNALLKAKGITEDQSAYFKLWKLCGTLLCFGQGFYASTDVEGMPFPFFNMNELKKACELVVHTLSGIEPMSTLPFSAQKFLIEFLSTFHLTMEELISPEDAKFPQAEYAKCKYKYQDTTLDLWVEIGAMNNLKK